MYPSPFRLYPHGPRDPRWAANVWEAATGPIAVQDMSPAQLKQAVAWVMEKVEESPLFMNDFPCLAAMLKRLENLRGQEV